MADHDEAGAAYQAGGSNHFMGHALGGRGTSARTRALRGLGYALEAVDQANHASHTGQIGSATSAAQYGTLAAKAIANGVDPVEVSKHQD